ncbi:MAG: hypothetical protein ACI4S2_17895 [Lachnospiraceae bacterium]
MQRYELWLDESGDFKDEQQKLENNRKPSLVGGILIRKEVAQSIDFSSLVHPEFNHATEMENHKKRDYILPALEALRELGAQEVFFENANYEDGNSNRDLYLRIMAEGLLQLLQRLNACHEDVSIDVLIARRQDADNSSNPIIQRPEYIAAINSIIERKKNEHKLLFSDNSSLRFDIGIANCTDKLILADFACNTRLTRDSAAFQEVRDRVFALHSDALIFTTTEVTSAVFVEVSMTQGNIADAVIELFMTKDEIDVEKTVELIFSKIQNMSYRLVKSQFSQLGKSITSYIYNEYDYEVGEHFLVRLYNSFIKKLLDNGFDANQLGFTVTLLLSDMYLREGDIVKASSILKKCSVLHEKMGDSMETLFTYYQLQEKIALYEIDSFQYRQAWDRMNKTSRIFEMMMSVVSTEGNLDGRFRTIKSEYYGDCLCMQIYAGMFLQSQNSSMYRELQRLSDIALKQYPGNEGELERHRQYRSRIEAEAGNLEEAVSWLMEAKIYERKSPTPQNLVYFLQRVSDSEEEVSRKYYLMYYLSIMSIAQDKRSDLADCMYNALVEQKSLLEEMKLIVFGQENQDAGEVSLENAKDFSTNILYHPMEVNCWRLGTYLLKRRGENWSLGLKYLNAAVHICFMHKNYTTMQVTGLSIGAHIMCSLLQQGCQESASVIEKKLSTYTDLEIEKLDEVSKRYISDLSACVKNKDYKKASGFVCY